MTRALILASASPIRLSLMQKAGLHPAVIPAALDEDSLKEDLRQRRALPIDVALELATKKAKHVSKAEPGAFVIGADQVLVIDGTLQSKPKTESDAVSQLMMMQGRSHRLISAVVVFEEAALVWQVVKSADLHMRSLSRSFLERYVREEWEKIQHCVGGYMIEDRGISLFTRINGDYHTILGLPILDLCNYLEDRGILNL
ncbi:MAG: nucleoside triphosphate pyrophosphatase [Pseudomonadota bacterium]